MRARSFRHKDGDRKIKYNLILDDMTLSEINALVDALHSVDPFQTPSEDAVHEVVSTILDEIG